MQKGFSAIVLILVGLLIMVLVVGFWVYKNNFGGQIFVQSVTDQEQKKLLLPSPSPTSDYIKPSAKNDLPPLYSGISWGSTESAKIRVFDLERFDNEREFDGKRIESKFVNYSTREFMQDFFGYYDKELLARGWVENSSAAADGMDGAQRGYKKENAYINLIYDGMNNGPDKKGTKLIIEYTVN